MSSQPISIHYQQMEEWLVDRKAVFARKHKKEYTELLSIAPRLVQVAQYDIPAIDKQLKRNETAVEECHRVGEEAQRTQQKLQERRAALLREYGIELPAGGGADVVQAVDQRVGEARAQVNAAFQAYARTRVAALKASYNDLLAKTAAGCYGDDPFAAHFPWMERALSEADLAAAGATDGGAGTAADDGDAAGPQIDWGDDDDGAAAVATAAPVEAAVEINWDAAELEVREEEDEAPPVPDGQHFSIDLSSAKHRVNVVAELQAAACFCRERGTTEQLDGAAAADTMRSVLSTSKEGELARMRESYRAKDAFLDRIDRFEQQMVVAHNRAAVHEAKMHDTEEELARLRPQREDLLANLRSMRDAALVNLQSMFPERNILIVGDLNKYIG